MANLKDYSGYRFHKMTVVSFIGHHHFPSGGQLAKWLCKCDCGTFTEVFISSLKSGNTMSCGCHHKAHGMTKTPFHNIWKSMKQRCNNPNSTVFKYYGGRGITICERWIDFKSFYEDMHPTYFANASLERVDVDGNYEPSNCIWIEKIKQAANKQKTFYVEYGGQLTRLMDLCGNDIALYKLAHGRISQYGWPVEKAISKDDFRKKA